MLVPEVPWKNYRKIMLSSKNRCKSFETGKSCLAKILYYIMNVFPYTDLEMSCFTFLFMFYTKKNINNIAPLAVWKPHNVKQE